MESIAGQALANPRTNDVAANFAGPLGLTPSSDRNAPAWVNRQVEFAFADGTFHYFAVENGRWQKALLIRVAPIGPDPRSRLFVTNREGALLAAGVIENRRLNVLSTDDPDVRRDFIIEQALWRLAGIDTACGAS
jgi:hypothetical protein